jgi:hypothetical protein
VGVLRVTRPETGAGVRAATGIGPRHERLARALVAIAALDLTVHLAQHVAAGLADPTWFFALGAVGAAGLWATAALWPRGSERARTAVLAILGMGLVWGGIAMHAADAIDDGLTLTHATGIAAGVLGVVLLVLALARVAGGRAA